METTMASLPPETWLEIAHFVKSYSLENLADLSLASSRLMSIARPVLYCDLTLKTTATHESWLPNLFAEHTFSLLARDVDLARSVRTLTLDATEEEEYEIVDTPILVDTASLRNMSQLKRLRILGRVFIRADEDLKEGYIEALCGLQLEELSFPWPYCFYPFSEDQFKRITDLKSIECYSEVDYHEDFAPRCLRLLSGSVSTLTSLSISAMYIDPDLAMQFLDLRFPLLRSLTFGTWSEEMHSLEGFHHFLLAHNQTLEHLEMGYTSRREVNPTAFLFDGDDDLPRCCLPNLRVFKGHCRNVKTVANASMRASLTKLTIGVSRVEEPKAEITLMLDEIQSERLMGCMGGLKELDFDFFAAEEDELEWIPAFIQKWGQICGPSLEIWRGLVPFTWTWRPDELADFFGAFTKLRVIWLAADARAFGVFSMEEDGEEEGEEDHDEEDMPTAEAEDYVRSLAQKCGALEEVWMVIWGHEKSCWKVEREAGSIISVRHAE